MEEQTDILVIDSSDHKATTDMEYDVASPDNGVDR